MVVVIHRYSFSQTTGLSEHSRVAVDVIAYSWENAVPRNFGITPLSRLSYGFTWGPGEI